MQQAYKAAEVFNAELKSAGAWVFDAGHPPATARLCAPRVAWRSPPVGCCGGAVGGFWIVKGARPGRRAGMGAAKESPACGGRWRSGRSRSLTRRKAVPTAALPPSSGRTERAWDVRWPQRSAPSVTSVSPRLELVAAEAGSAVARAAKKHNLHVVGSDPEPDADGSRSRRRVGAWSAFLCARGSTSTDLAGG